MAPPHKAPKVRRHKGLQARRHKAVVRLRRHYDFLQFFAKTKIPRISQAWNDIFMRIENGIDSGYPNINLIRVGVLQDVIDALGATENRDDMGVSRFAAVSNQCFVCCTDSVN